LNRIATCVDATGRRSNVRLVGYRELPMIETLWGVVVLILRAINFGLDIVVSISRLQRLARWATGSEKIVAVPPDPKILPPAAQRALAEAEQRRASSGAKPGICQ
jgi:hypothetical protein